MPQPRWPLIRAADPGIHVTVRLATKSAGPAPIGGHPPPTATSDNAPQIMNDSRQESYRSRQSSKPRNPESRKVTGASSPVPSSSRSPTWAWLPTYGRTTWCWPTGATCRPGPDRTIDIQSPQPYRARELRAHRPNGWEAWIGRVTGALTNAAETTRSNPASPDCRRHAARAPRRARPGRGTRSACCSTARGGGIRDDDPHSRATPAGPGPRKRCCGGSPRASPVRTQGSVTTPLIDIVFQTVYGLCRQ